MNDKASTGHSPNGASQQSTCHWITIRTKYPSATSDRHFDNSPPFVGSKIGQMNQFNHLTLLLFALTCQSSWPISPVQGFGLMNSSKSSRGKATGRIFRTYSAADAVVASSLVDTTIQERTTKARKRSVKSSVTNDDENDDNSDRTQKARKMLSLVDIDKVPKRGRKSNEKTGKLLYWRLEGDPFRIEQDLNRTAVVFKIRGNPLPLRRHRTSRGFMYNPSAGAQADLSNLVRHLIWPDEAQSNRTTVPLFGDEDQLLVSLVFCMKRPLSHFIGSKREEGRLKKTASNRVASIRTDVDNLAKFILDSLNGMIYADDKQVASIHATKYYDSEGLCLGSTLVFVKNLKESDLDGILEMKL